MLVTQNETRAKSRVASRETRKKAMRRSRKLATRNPQLATRAFTLVELLVVITIIGILAGLITGAAIRALNKAKQAAITMELQNIGGAMENLKNDFGAYPPNAVTPPGITNTNDPRLVAVRSDVQRALKKAFPRIAQSELNLINQLIGDASVGGMPDQGGYLTNGLSASEAIVLWLGGFSKDVTLPFSGPGGPSFRDNDNNGSVDPSLEVLENRNWSDGFEFDLGRLGPRNSDGQFNGRFIIYTANGVDHKINLWTYNPSGSQQPIVYFDTSNITPQQRFTGAYNYELRSIANPNDTNSLFVFPIRQALETVTIPNPGVAQTKYVNQGKFQLLHCGTDDIWGDFTLFSSTSGVNTTAMSTDVDNNPLAVLFPSGPFIGDVADTLGSFMSGTLEEKQE